MEDDELEPTAEELAQEEREEPQMVEHAGMWDHFLDYVEAAEREWAPPERDTDEYRKERAVELFNLGECHKQLVEGMKHIHNMLDSC
eukprot:1910602-Pleurochrysis_carterae.AAC.1